LQLLIIRIDGGKAKLARFTVALEKFQQLAA
jgi:hypothetical protein